MWTIWLTKIALFIDSGRKKFSLKKIQDFWLFFDTDVGRRREMNSLEKAEYRFRVIIRSVMVLNLMFQHIAGGVILLTYAQRSKSLPDKNFFSSLLGSVNL